MQDQEYKVVAISPEPAKEHTNAYGTTWYRSVKIADAQGNVHPKPISLGKKDPNAFHEGLEIYGHILTEQSFPTDKFKATKNPNFGGGQQQASYGGASKPAYQPRDDDAIRAQWAIGQAVTAHLGQPKSDGNLHFDVIEEYAERFYAMVGRVKGSNTGGTPDPKVPNPATSQPTGNPARLKKGDPVWPSEHSDAEAESLYQSIASSEPTDEGESFDMSQIPF